MKMIRALPIFSSKNHMGFREDPMFDFDDRQDHDLSTTATNNRFQEQYRSKHPIAFELGWKTLNR